MDRRPNTAWDVNMLLKTTAKRSRKPTFALTNRNIARLISITAGRRREVKYATSAKNEMADAGLMSVRLSRLLFPPVFGQAIS